LPGWAQAPVHLVASALGLVGIALLCYAILSSFEALGDIGSLLSFLFVSGASCLGRCVIIAGFSRAPDTDRRHDGVPPLSWTPER
jgi:hypothetical protein